MTTTVIWCNRCDGTGVLTTGPIRVCERCRGTGHIVAEALPAVANGYQGRNDDDGDGDGV